jgi:hypothetical protein
VHLPPLAKVRRLPLMEDTLKRLQDWFKSQCNGTWEHDSGVSIETTDNPGWWLRVNLVGTALESRSFSPVNKGNCLGLDPRPPWSRCYVENGVFNGAGDADSLDGILETFVAWAEQVTK